MLGRLLDILPRAAWRVLAWLGVAVVVALSLFTVPVPSGLDFWNSDKLVHMSMYGSLMLCFSRGYRRAYWLRIALALGLLGGTIEFLQSLTPDRSASLLDEIANLGGISIMLWLVRRAPHDAQPESEKQAKTDQP